MQTDAELPLQARVPLGPYTSRLDELLVEADVLVVVEVAHNSNRDVDVLQSVFDAVERSGDVSP